MQLVLADSTGRK